MARGLGTRLPLGRMLGTTSAHQEGNHPRVGLAARSFPITSIAYHLFANGKSSLKTPSTSLSLNEKSPRLIKLILLPRKQLINCHREKRVSPMFTSFLELSSKMLYIWTDNNDTATA